MSLRTSAGIAQVHHPSRAFDLSRAALYKAASPEERPKVRSERRRPEPTSITDERLLTEIRTIATEHAAWGHRKVWAMLRWRAICVARRRVWKLMHEAQLTFSPDARRCEPRGGTVIVPKPNRRWSTDMTTVWSRKDGWVAVTPVIDNGCRTVFEIGVTKAQDAPAILRPLEDRFIRRLVNPVPFPAISSCAATTVRFTRERIASNCATSGESPTRFLPSVA